MHLVPDEIGRPIVLVRVTATGCIVVSPPRLRRRDRGGMIEDGAKDSPTFLLRDLCVRRMWT